MYTAPAYDLRMDFLTFAAARAASTAASTAAQLTAENAGASNMTVEDAFQTGKYIGRRVAVSRFT
jgi:hypothetical protein